MPGVEPGAGRAGLAEEGRGPSDGRPSEAGRGQGPSHGATGKGGVAPTPRTGLASFLAGAREIVLVLGIALTLSLVLKTFLVQAFFIPSGSMLNTLQIGDRVLVSKLTPGPLDLHRGDVVVFEDPGGWLEDPQPRKEGPVRREVRQALTFVGVLPNDSGNHLIKRVIGLPGDRVQCCDAEGRITVNGHPISEPYLFPGDEPSGTPFAITVPPGHVWVMGDHRSDSADSRFHQEVASGTVPVDLVVGRAFVIVWPLRHATVLHRQDSVFRSVPAP